MAPAAILVLLPLLFYSVVILILNHGLKKSLESAQNRPVERVNEGEGWQLSVVVPFRNEAARLPLLLGDLQAQTCAGDQFEVILVNDLHRLEPSFGIRLHYREWLREIKDAD